MSYIPTCPYCGQILSSGTREFNSQADADKWAASQCNCSEAYKERKRQEQIDFAKERVRQLFGEEAAEFGFEPVANTEMIDLLNDVIENIAYGRLRGATLQMKGSGKAVISTTSENKIRVKRSITHACQLEE